MRINKAGKTLRKIAGAPFIGASVIAVLASGCAPSQTSGPHCHPINAWLTKQKDEAIPTLLTDQQIDEIDTVVTTMMANPKAPHEVPGCGVAITRNDKIAGLLTYGYSRMSPDPVAFDLGTLSGFGSVSKTFTALATMKMMQSGQIPYPGFYAESYLKTDADVPWAGAFVIDLLSHTAGLTPQPVWDAGRFDSAETIHAYFPETPWPSLHPSRVAQGFMYNNATMIGAPANGKPSQPIYSNASYILLGAIIDSVSQALPVGQRGYENYVWHHVARGNALAEPASPAMCAGAGLREKDMPTLAHGHSLDGERYNMSDSPKFGWGWAIPAGGWWGTTGDLARLMLVMQSELVVPESYINGPMRKDIGPLSPDIDDSMRIGMGLELSPKNALRRWYGKGGDIVGYTAGFRIWPGSENNDKNDWGVAFMCNRVKSGSVGDGSHVLDAIYDVLHQANGGIVQIDVDTSESTLVRSALSRYASRDQRMDAAALERLQRDVERLPGGRTLLAALREGDWASFERSARSMLDASVTQRPK